MNKWQYLPRGLFWSEKHWERARVYSRLKTGTGKCEGCFRLRNRRMFSEDFGLLRKTSDFFGRLRTSSGIFGNDRVVLKNPSTPRIKISRLYFRKKLAGIRGTLLLFYSLLVCLFTWQRLWKRNIRPRLIARCFGFPLHNFITGSDSQKFRVSAYSRDRLIDE